MVSPTTTNTIPSRTMPQASLPHPAGFFSRAEAFVIDLVVISLVQVFGSAFVQIILRFFRLIGFVDNFLNTLEQTGIRVAIGTIAIALLVIGYYTFFWTLVGFTPGKAVLGLRVLRPNGKKISFFRALVRFFSYWISAIPLFLGYFWVLWDPKRQAWHDKLAGTQVIYIPKKPQK